MRDNSWPISSSCAFAIVAALLAGCLEPPSRRCSNGRVCPANLVCALDQCVLPDQIAQCEGKVDGTTCTLAGASEAACRSGVCLALGCGNGFLDPGEVCDDGNNLAGDGCSPRCDSNEACGNGIVDAYKNEGCDCGDADDTVRAPGCTGPNSDADDSTCLTNCTIRGCGDHRVNGLEDCDGPELGTGSCQTVGYYGGTIGCLDSCRYDVSSCVGSCGDGVVNGPEVCDGQALDGKTCTDFGFYQPGGLACNALCGFDTSQCLGRCGDGTVNGAEACEPTVALTQDCTDLGFYQPAGLSCTQACGLDASACVGRCGDGTVNGPEACEVGMLGGLDCQDFDFYQPGGLACTGCVFDTSACIGKCGDGVANIADGESCDETDLDNKTCLDFGFYAVPGLACSAACGFDVSGCGGGSCGDGLVQSANGEVCDTTVPSTIDCTDFGYYDAKPVTCSGACGFDLSQCTGYCGDGQTNGPEDCDATITSGATCQSEGYYTGTLACNAGCRYDVSACSGFCGDGTINGTEVCEAGNLAGKDCTDFNYYQPAGLACSGCTFDTRACQQRCGDNIIDVSEACDGTSLAGQTCASRGHYGGTLACNAACGFDESACQFCGDGVLQTAEGELCDGTQLAAGYDCTDFGFYAAPGLTCNAICDLDPQSCSGGQCGDLLVNGPEACDDGPPLGETCVSAGYDAGLLGCSSGCGATAGSCRYLSFQSEDNGFATPEFVNDFSEVSGTLLAVSNDRVIVDSGSGWKVVATATNADLEDIWAISPTQAVAVARRGGFFVTAWSYDNGVLSPMPTDPAAALEDVWGTAANNIYAVGAEGSVGVVYRWNGSMWNQVATAGTRLRGIWGTADNNIYAVGNGGTAIRFNGITWNTVTVTGATAADIFTTVSGTGPNDVIIGSDLGIYTGTANGTSWSKTTCGTDVVTNIKARAGRGAYALGTTVLCYRAGSTWLEVDDGLTSGDAAEGLWIAANGEVLLGRVADILRSGGATWKALPSQSSQAVWGTSPTELYVGNRALSTGAELVYRLTGASWTGMGLAAPTSGHEIFDLWGSGSQLVAVGRYGRLSRYTGSWSTTTIDLGAGSSFLYQGVWGSDPDHVWAVGTGGTIVKWNGVSWQQQTSNTTSTLLAVHGFSQTDVWALGTNRVVVRTTDGTNWSASTIPAPSNVSFQALWGRSSTDLFVGGSRSGSPSSPVVYHYNGNSWSPMPVLAATGFITKIVGTLEGDVFASGNNFLLQLVGRRWIPVKPGVAGQQFTDVHGGSGFVAVVSPTTQHLLLGSINSCGTSEAGSCSDYQDNDCDGAIDCADTECAGNAWCAAGGSCRPTTSIGCGQTTGGTTIGGPHKRSGYACGLRQTSGREAYFHFVPTTSGMVTVTLNGFTGDLDLLIAGSQNGACVPDVSCIGSSQQTSGTSETVMFNAQAGQAYELIVDGYEGAASAFSLQVGCM